MHDIDIYLNTDNYKYLSRHPEIEHFDMPKTFYFRYLPDRLQIHWAIIKPVDECVNVYFINEYGRIFDKLEFKSVKIARRRLRKCGFDFSTNKCCEEVPREPLYIQLSEGKKSAPYSKGNLFQSVQRDRKISDKAKKSYNKGWATYEKKWAQERKNNLLKSNEKVIINKNSDYSIESILIVILLFFILTFILTTMAGW